MGPTKGLLQSTSAVGAIASILAGFVSLLLKLDPEQAKEVLATSTQVVEVVFNSVTIGGSILALYGRIMATKRITIAGNLPAQPKKG